MTYKWESKDHLIALLLFKIGASSKDIEKATEEIGLPVCSLKKRIQNVEYLRHGTGKMSHFAKQTK